MPTHFRTTGFYSTANTLSSCRHHRDISCDIDVSTLPKNEFVLLLTPKIAVCQQQTTMDSTGDKRRRFLLKFLLVHHQLTILVAAAMRNLKSTSAGCSRKGKEIVRVNWGTVMMTQ
jgi:hypothetical protein